MKTTLILRRDKALGSVQKLMELVAKRLLKSPLPRRAANSGGEGPVFGQSLAALMTMLVPLLMPLAGCGGSGDPGTKEPLHWQQYLSPAAQRLSGPNPFSASNGKSAPNPADAAPAGAGAPATGAIQPAGYVGAGTCAECHRDQYESYLRTAHSQALRLADQSTRQAPAEFVHSATDRRYQVFQHDGRMVHREFIHGRDGETIAVNEAAMAHEVGSGIHAHSYLFRSGKFHVQSPLTWYADGAHWDLSPGFDPSERATFARAVTTTCVFCHVGRIRVTDPNPHHFSIEEQAISCERCHGPGEGHVQRHRMIEMESPPPADAFAELPPDLIVHPGLLDRQRAGDICAQCHLQGTVFSGPSGQDSWDFRPGERLSRYRTDFKVEGRGDEFRIVGHTEQLHGSACYQGSRTLTCTTCHDPHPPADVDPIERQRQNCLQCHDDATCGVAHAQRQQVNNNDCAACHMPARPTNVPHAALHDHRIAVHPESFHAASIEPPAEFLEQEAERTEASTAADPQLRPILPDDSLPQWQQQRRWALALHSLMLHRGNLQGLEEEVALAQRTLVELHRQGHTDPSITSILAMDYLQAGDLRTATALARHVRQQVPASSGSGIGATHVLSQIALRRQDNAAARDLFAELTRYRYVTADHFMLGLCERNAGNTDAAIRSLERALMLDPTLVNAHDLLAEILQSAGQAERAAAHRRAASAIRAAGDRVPAP